MIVTTVVFKKSVLPVRQEAETTVNLGESEGETNDKKTSSKRNVKRREGGGGG